MKTAGREFGRVMGELKGIGLLLMSDARLPNVASLFAGEPIRGSWWSHPRAHDIFAGLEQLENHKDVLFTKLVSGKVTLVHRRFWNDLVAIGLAREVWQTRGLTKAASHLSPLVEAEGLVQSDSICWPGRLQPVKIGDAVRELESRLLIHTEEVHTSSGSHAKLLETWEHWADRIGFKLDARPSSKSKLV
ncbi:MAG TPA: hypothetical protein VJ180_09055, partial [Pyrinomonadaceae bacterium]|nr:hypothetical protein [Pyrinomonadaceae bacterium]